MGDWNSDARVDLVATTAINGSKVFELVIGNGDGTFDPPLEVDSGDDADGVVAADWNGDGHLDLALSNDFYGRINVLLGNGNGSFTSTGLYKAGKDPLALAAADFD